LTIDTKMHNTSMYRPGTLQDFSLANFFLSLSMSIYLS